MSLSAAEIAELEVERAKLRKRLNSGVRSVRDGETYVENVSVADMERRLRSIDAILAEAGGTSRRRTTYVKQVSRAL